MHIHLSNVIPFEVTCQMCDGTGMVMRDRMLNPCQPSTCPDCAGFGVLDASGVLEQSTAEADAVVREKMEQAASERAS